MQLLTILSRLAIAFWVGGASLFTFVLTPIIFTRLPRDQAGVIVGHLFPAYFRWGLACGAIALITRFLLKDMLLKKWGRIINVVSLSGIKGLPGQANYSAAKAGVIGATKALAQEIAKKNVTVNAVAPGFIRTDMTADMDETQLKTMIPAGRFGKPEEVAAVVGFLASEEASYVTGTVVNVNGGLYT